ncbi:TetR/AcrR family transcriptional regulator [Thermostaphylospora chromogena]|uniref:Regulatory protein, tetR family n=1 Tax=Thermostaphylospora chromogena TaxID=35622 RepID=A0A1H1FEE8_9ACTN|nr:TetR/AcrR family transcriptional regulator [Thermostaphylospora chromogena]SDQ99287.1 regulatory protein, tetR family [Thermostaphylospora chromogena]
MMTTLDRGNETRARILAAARRLFAERGYAATSLADIASAVGLTKTAVAYHFNPKGRIAAELIAPAADDMLALLGTDFGGDRRAFAEALVGFSTRHRTVIRLMIEDVGLADDAPPGSIGEVLRSFRDELYTRLAGPDPTAAERIRAWAVIGAIQCVVTRTVDLPERSVHDDLRAAVLAVLDRS